MPHPLEPWSNYYVITGSAAAALTGLMFVVITLVSSSRLETTHEGIRTYSTPTVVHFSTVLLVSALLCAPWPSLFAPTVLLMLIGIIGAAYIMRIGQRARRLTAYTPDLEDWLSYSVAPFFGYAAMLVSGIMLLAHRDNGLYACALGVALLLFIGIHNAWDVVTYITIGTPGKSDENANK